MSDAVQESLDEKLERIACSPVLLVATDYDGTLAPIVPNPDDARPLREAVVALRALASLDKTQVAIISGRSLSDLARLAGAPEAVHLVGSHGSEFDPGFSERLTEAERALHTRLVAELEAIAGRADGLTVEHKPASIAFHYRNATEAEAEAAVQAVLDGPAKAPGVETRTGKMVIELSVVPTDKGRAVDSLRQRFGATAVVFLGDDVTDEDAFARLSDPDLAIKIGPGETLATHRQSGPEEVARFLARLAEKRRAWLLGSQAEPIEDHSMLSDLRTVALISPTASVAWFCAPRIDSSALFAEILGGTGAGTFQIRPADGSRPEHQSYVEGSLVLETRWAGVRLLDYLDASQGRLHQRAGRCDLVRVLEGHGEVDLCFAPRIDFGRVPTELVQREEGLEVEGGVDGIVLRSQGVEWEIRREGQHHTAHARVVLTGEPVVLDLRFGTADLARNRFHEQERRQHTLAAWHNWAERLVLPEVARNDVLLSALLLRGLTHGPSGGIAAAATTSLPEHIGGVRNWDYRFCWLRDGAMSAEALLRLGSTKEAMQFLDWVLNVLDHLHDPERLRPLYTVVGGELGPEAEIGELSGYAGSRPVRVGNGASNQVQLDVFGPIVQLVLVLCEAGAPLSQEHSRLVEKLVKAVTSRWHEPDHGIWEIRGKPRHHVHSKVMCWMTVDRAIRIWESFGRRPPENWLSVRDEIANEVGERGWNERVGAFTCAYEADEVDAASLWVGLSGLVPFSDPRFLSTVEVTARELQRGDTVYRYLYADGLPGQEGGFHICLSWLIDSLVAVGRVDEAGELFERLRALAGRTGCLPEEYDPVERRGLGNHPQAYSHLGLILNALNLEAAGWREAAAERDEQAERTSA